jgi:hypothetical protein
MSIFASPTAVASAIPLSDPTTAKIDANWIPLGNSIAVIGGAVDTIQDIRNTAQPQFFSLNIRNDGTAQPIIEATSDTPTASAVLQFLKTRVSGGGNVASGDRLGQLSFGGSNGASSVFGVRIAAYADENYSGTAQGSHVVISTTPIGSTTRLDRVIVNANGLLQFLAYASAQVLMTDASGNVSGATTAAVTFGSVQTGTPSGGTAAPWKMGSYKTGTVALDTAHYIEVDIGGTLHKILTAS